MTNQERYDEIVSLSGMSEDIVRRVLNATRKSIQSSLERGENATVPGICSIKPSIQSKVATGGDKIEHYISAKATVAPGLLKQLEDKDCYDVKDDEYNEENDIEDIITMQIPALV